eukprot:scaffold275428_cov27-Tisochrysis_lutea.AAC.1
MGARSLALVSALVHAAAAPPSAPGVQTAQHSANGYVIGVSEPSASCAGDQCDEKQLSGYSYQPIDPSTTAGISAAGIFNTRSCYDLRQVLLIAAQIPNADGSWRTCEELAVLGATHPAAKAEKRNSDLDKFMARQRRWFEKNMAAQLRELLRAQRPSLYIVAAAPNRENGPAKGPVLLRCERIL